MYPLVACGQVALQSGCSFTKFHLQLVIILASLAAYLTFWHKAEQVYKLNNWCQKSSSWYSMANLFTHFLYHFQTRKRRISCPWPLVPLLLISLRQQATLPLILLCWCLSQGKRQSCHCQWVVQVWSALNKRSIRKKAPFTIHFLFAWKKQSQILDTSKDIGHIVLVPSPHKLHYTALLTLYIVSVCGHPCGIIGAHAQSHIPSGHWQCLHVWCPMSHAMASLVSCLQLAIYTLHQTQLHQKTIFQEKKISLSFLSFSFCL